MITPKKPEYLQEGDKIAIIATAGVVDRMYIEIASSILNSWGLKVTYGKSLFEKEELFAGSDKQRLEDLQNALDDEKIKAILCARGGYGTIRIIDKIDWTNFIERPKWILGFSDITIIHAKVHNLGVESIHCPMPINMANLPHEDPVLKQLKNVLFTGSLMFANIHHHLNRNGFGRARLIGGNLSILYSLVGTPLDIDYSDKFLFIEDVGEQLYHVDRMLQTLKLAGKFDELEGLLVGSFTEMEDNKMPFGKSLEKIIYEITEEYNFPVAFGLPVGHQKNNHPLILGSEIKLEISNKQAKIRFL